MRLRIELLIRTLDADDGLRRVHLFDGAGAEQTFVLVVAAAKLQQPVVDLRQSIGEVASGLDRAGLMVCASDVGASSGKLVTTGSWLRRL